VSYASGLPADAAFAIDFNLHQVPAALGLAVPPSAGAALVGISEAQFLAYAGEVQAEVEAVACELLDEPGLAAVASSLRPGATIMTVGDSITTYRRGYAELLRAMLNRRYPEDGIRVLNVAQSGYTSTHARESTYTQWLAQGTDLVFVMYGANDCKRFGSPQARTLVSLREYTENLTAIVEAFQTDTARVMLLTPTPVVTDVTNRLPDFVAMRMTWDNADLAACAEAVRRIAGQHGAVCVDLFSAFGPQPDPALYLPDGLHPGPAGQRVILETILTSLCRSTT
jgi:acyl-CoA thioesterase I